MIPLESALKVELLHILKKLDIVKSGEFLLKDGTISSIYIDLRILPNFPKEFQRVIKIASMFLDANHLIQTIEGITAPPLAGIPLGVALSLELEKSFFLTRVQQKDHGTRKLIEGDIRGKRILIVDDVITSGASKDPIIQSIKAYEGQICGLFVILNRIHNKEILRKFLSKNKVNFYYLLDFEDIKAIN
ncbi:orotate phosphoribosyltransferase [Candidatus Hodarchaeum mangrovi]